MYSNTKHVLEQGSKFRPINTYAVYAFIENNCYTVATIRTRDQATEQELRLSMYLFLPELDAELPPT